MSSVEWGWEKHVADRNWDEVENWWWNWHVLHPEDPAPLTALMAALRKIVPKISVQNGMELMTRHIDIEDDPKFWEGREDLKGAATILRLGELEAAIEGDPPVDSETWTDHRAMVENHLKAFLSSEEVTKGAEELSRQEHTRKALEHLAEIDRATNLMCREMDTDEDRNWLREFSAIIAYLAFEAGRRTQAAWGKGFEKLAASREKQIQTLSNANEGRNEHNLKKKKRAAAWHKHARRVAAINSHSPTKSSLAQFILKNWERVGDQAQRPAPPALSTIQNWLSKQEN